MDRRGFLKTGAGALGATVGALALHRGIRLPELMREGVQGRQVGMTLARRDQAGETSFGEMTLVTGPDRDTYVFTALGENGEAAVLPPNTEAPFPSVHGFGMPRSLFPEYDPEYGTVGLPSLDTSGPVTVQTIREAYAVTLHNRRH